MAWDNNKLKKQLQEFKLAFSSSEDKEFKKIAKYDYNVIYEMLKSQDSTLEELDKDLLCQKDEYIDNYSDFLNESFEQLIANKRIFFELSKLMEHLVYKNSKMFPNRSIPFFKLIEMDKEFLAFFNPFLYELMVNNLDEHVEFFKFRNNKSTLNKLGLCYPIFSINESFISIDMRRKGNFDVLPHELAHSEEFFIIDEFANHLCWKVSSFVESYPNFVALAFCDYFENSEYGDLCLEKKQLFFDSIKVMMETYIYHISCMKDFDIKKNKIILENNTTISKKEIDYLISSFMSIYMLYLYNNETEEFGIFIKKYHSFIGKSDKEIWGLIDFEKLLIAIQNESTRLNESITLSRKRTKNF